jgi:hypothetical protein
MHIMPQTKNNFSNFRKDTHDVYNIKSIWDDYHLIKVVLKVILFVIKVANVNNVQTEFDTKILNHYHSTNCHKAMETKRITR